MGWHGRRAIGRHRFSSRYTAEDIVLLAEVDRTHERLGGPATRRILQREYEPRPACCATAKRSLQCRLRPDKRGGGPWKCRARGKLGKPKNGFRCTRGPSRFVSLNAETTKESQPATRPPPLSRFRQVLYITENVCAHPSIGKCSPDGSFRSARFPARRPP